MKYIYNQSSIFTGYEPLDLGKMDPLEIPQITIGNIKHPNTPTDVIQQFKNIEVHGLANSEVLDIR